jgi:hypothetical protein
MRRLAARQAVQPCIDAGRRLLVCSRRNVIMRSLPA